MHKYVSNSQNILKYDNILRMKYEIIRKNQFVAIMAIDRSYAVFDIIYCKTIHTIQYNCISYLNAISYI